MTKKVNRPEKLRTWLASTLGQAFIKAEALFVKKMASTLFGYHLLWLGELPFRKCIEESPITHQVHIHPEENVKQDKEGGLITRYDKLPILSDNIDVVYLAHCLEFVKNPHEVLREAFRVLIPEGHVIISNFNPYSLWGLWKYCTRFIKRMPWDGYSITVARLKDWLALLGFDVVDVRPYFFRPPIAHAGLLKHLVWLERVGKWCWPFWSGGYVLLARKRIITLTPIKPLVRTQPKILIADAVEPVGIE